MKDLLEDWLIELYGIVYYTEAANSKSQAYRQDVHGKALITLESSM